MPARKESKPQLTVVFTPDGFILDIPETDLEPRSRHLHDAYEKDKWELLFQMGFEPVRKDDVPGMAFLHTFAAAFIRCLSAQPALEITREQTDFEPDEMEAENILAAVPFGIGTEYITDSWLRNGFARLLEYFRTAIQAYSGTVEMFLTERSQDLRIPERVFFHLVENKKPGQEIDEDYPFAFMATYTTRIKGRVRHQPLSYALTEFKGQQDKLVALLSCLNQAAEISPLIGGFMESGELLHPLRLTSDEAWQFLKSVEAIESAGICCRLPNWWRRKASRVTVSVKLGEKSPSLLGLDAIISMKPTLTVDGQQLTQAEIRQLLKMAEGLVLIKGKWVEVDHEQLRKLLGMMEDYEGDLTMMEALRLEAGLGKQNKDTPEDVEITNGKWLQMTFQNLRDPSKYKVPDLPGGVHAELRPYQMNGYGWLCQMGDLGFGACLADDMGLGKTLQVLSFLERVRMERKDARVLLIVPATLMGNWEKEAARFTPGISIRRLHGQTGTRLDKMLREEKSDALVTMTTYSMASKIEALAETNWDYVILDEAQAIKNPGTKQAKAIKALKARRRIALTGTPIENDLTNLWSLFDFLNQGLLGSAKEFSDFAKALPEAPDGYMKLKRMISPFILRRLKTDKTIISDLPDKVETVDYITLTKKQSALYRSQIEEIEKSLKTLEGIQRKGVVLAVIGKLKQICNHPDQYLGLDEYAEKDSGKFEVLREICETIRDKHERVLIFTQYREITQYLADFLEGVFGRPGLVLHGETKVKDRQAMVDAFNSERYIPFMVLTIKAGGTGLNLTAANHVIHFDRWWNPAVENQATDRAFRIGQKNNVIVHKFVAEGTIEEKIDELIRSKSELARNIIGSSGESWITEMSNEELLEIMKLEV
ncbi:MAG: DEAD/DEAH box helicase [Clostridia bacterium]|nr:DEAD/DEAH box helicase [Clostridia bacterium]